MTKPNDNDKKKNQTSVVDYDQARIQKEEKSMEQGLKAILTSGLGLLVIIGIVYLFVYRPKRFELFAINISNGQFVYGRMLSKDIYLAEAYQTKKISTIKFKTFINGSETILDLRGKGEFFADLDRLSNRVTELVQTHKDARAKAW